jgi:hypothetical protein
LVSGEPYGTDSWYLLASSNPSVLSSIAVSSNPPSLGSSPVPALFGRVFVLVTGLSSQSLLPVVFPILSCLTVLLVFLIARSLTAGFRASLLASLLVSVTAIPGLLYSGVTSEGFAVNLGLLAVYLLLCKASWGLSKKWASGAVALVALALSHQIFAVYLGIILLSTVSLVVVKARPKRELVPISVATALSALLLYAGFPGLSRYASLLVSPLFIILGGAVSVAFYTMERLGFQLFVRGGRLRNGAVILASVATCLSASYLMLTGTRSVPSMSVDAVLMVLPYLALAPLAFIGLRHAALSGKGGMRAIVDPWLLLLLGAVAYVALFSSQSVIAVRLLGQLFFPVAIFAGVALEMFYTRRSTRLLAAVVGLAFVFVLALPFYWIPFGAGSYGGSQLAYSPSDVSSMEWLKSYGGGASGDYRYGYLAAYYGVPYGNLLSLTPVLNGSSWSGFFLMSQAYYYRGYFPGGLANLQFPPLDETALPFSDVTYSNDRITLYLV